MLKQRKEAAMKLAERLFEAETAIDEAISKVADLASHMPIARTSANLSAIIGQDAITEAGQGLVTLIEARNKLVNTHHQLALVRDQVGLRELAFGSGADKPPLAARCDKLHLVDSAA